ncbi:MAG TPA: tyrosine-protein phosphatase [Gammaproteobacteria bacterium]|nr:tyrosine-protein phosphatase [Gammaproteobacteria bacterium]
MNETPAAPDGATTRVLPLEGGCNFRDLGGYRATDGRRVRPARLYRSGVMAYLTPADQQRLARIGVHTIVDLRRADERAQEPTRWPDPTVRVLAHDDPRDRSALQGLAGEQPATRAGMYVAMTGFYRSMPAWLAPRLRLLFEALAGGAVPLVFHCSAGKDRTGLAAALVLELLGVAREDILADYALTNQAVDLEAFLARERSARLGLSDSSHPLLTLEPEARRPMLNADADYLATALDTITAEYGSTEDYLRSVVGIGASERERICELLLT